MKDTTKIKICKENAKKIEALLAEINGKSREHTYTTYDDIVTIAKHAEMAVSNLPLPMSCRNGARYHATSGQPVAHKYKGKRNGTRIEILRGLADWYLISVVSVDLWPNQGGTEKLTLTSDQDVEIIKQMRKKYCVQQ